jgi:site-specific DNA-methyltransferase (cytosine-N4-specific)
MMPRAACPPGEWTHLTSAVARKLQSICWDFANARTGDGPHGIHPYPAKFIPQLPRTLIDLFHPGDSSPVLDPFCGSGTTLVEARAAGIDSIGLDLHPLATLITKVKTTPLKAPLAQAAREIVAAAQRRLSAGPVEVPPIPRVDHWFQKHVQQALAATIAAINELDAPDVADALCVALSSIIVRVSNQDSDTRYAAVEKDVSQDDVWLGFERAAASIGSALRGIDKGLFRQGSARVLTKDLMTVEPQEVGSDIGLVITSPPYPNAYEYWLYHKYRMYWLGMDPIAVREREIGARPHYFKVNHQTEADFEQQMGRCFWLLSRVMRKGAHACFVVGRSIIHTREIDNEAILERAAARHGFAKAGSVARNIPLNRKSFNLAHGTINREQIVVFALEGA